MMTCSDGFKCLSFVLLDMWIEEERQKERKKKDL